MKTHNKVVDLTVTNRLMLGREAQLYQMDRAGVARAVEFGGPAPGPLAESLTAAKVLTAEDSGNTYFLNAAGGFAVTLPAPQLGAGFRFIVGTAPSGGSYVIGTNGGADIIKGMVLEAPVTGAGPVDQNADAVTLVDGVALAGDQLDLVSDGTSWFVKGYTQADGGATLTTT